MSTLNRTDVDCRIVDATDGALTLDELIALSATDTAALFISPYGVIKGGRVVANVTNSADFVKTSNVVSDAATPNTVVGRDEQGDIYTRCIVDDSGLFCAFPHSVEQTKDEADYILQEEISDLETIRSGAKKGATSVQASDVSTAGEPNKVVRLDENADIAARLFHDTDSDLTWAFPRSTEEATEWADGVLQEQIEDLEEIREGAKNSLPATIEYNEYTFTEKVTPEVKNESATIRSIKGNSLVWNSLTENGKFLNGVDGNLPNGWKNGTYYMTNRADITYPSDGGILLTAKAGVSGNATMLVTQFQGGLINVNDKCLITFDYRSDFQWAIGDDTGGLYRITIPASDTKIHQAIFTSFTVNLTKLGIQFLVYYTGGQQLWVNNLFVYNLTQMFGAGNEPTTVEEFYARKPIGVDENAYNEGKFISFNANGIQSNGINIWDEQYADGYYDTSGNYVNDYNYLCSLNKIKCESNTQYAFLSTSLKVGSSLYICYYRSDGSAIERVIVGHSTTGTTVITTPLQCTAFAFAFSKSNYGQTYNKDISVYQFNGSYNVYTPYLQNIVDFSPINMFFPLRSIGSLYDEIYFDKYLGKWKSIKRLDVVDMGELNWMYDNSYGGFFANLPTAKKSFIGRCEKYPFRGAYSDVEDNQCGFIYSTAIFVKDSTYNSAAEFQSSIGGVKFIFELKEPQTSIIGFLNLDYKAQQYGDEKLIASDATTPIIAEIGYNYDAKSKIEALSQSVGSMLGGSADAIRLADGSTITFDELKTRLGL